MSLNYLISNIVYFNGFRLYTKCANACYLRLQVNEDFGRGVRVDGSVLRIENAQVTDRGMYVCDATSSGGSARAVTVIEVERKFRNWYEITFHITIQLYNGMLANIYRAAQNKLK